MTATGPGGASVHDPLPPGRPGEVEAAAAPLDSSRPPLYDPPRRLVPSPGRDRPWRRGIVLAGSAVMALAVLVLAAATTATWWNGRLFGDVPATTVLGTPSSLQLTSSLGDVRVQSSDEVDQVTLSLVAPGTTVPATADETARALVERSGGSSSASVRVSQPESFSTWPGTDDSRDVLLLVPSGHELDLDLRSDVGDVVAEGVFGSLRVQADVGDVHLGPVAATEEVSVTADVGSIEAEIAAPGPAAVDLSSSIGDVALQLPADAGGTVGAVTELGDVRIAVAGTSTWEVESRSAYGEVTVDPDLHGTQGEAAGTLTAVTETGDVTLTR